MVKCNTHTHLCLVAWQSVPIYDQCQVSHNHGIANFDLLCWLSQEVIGDLCTEQGSWKSELCFSSTAQEFHSMHGGERNFCARLEKQSNDLEDLSSIFQAQHRNLSAHGREGNSSTRLYKWKVLKVQALFLHSTAGVPFHAWRGAACVPSAGNCFTLST